MGNAFDLNKQVAIAHVRSEQIKGWFLANAKIILILLSGSFLFTGIVIIATPYTSVSQAIANWSTAILLLPIAFIACVFAIAIEGGTLFSASILKETLAKIKQENDLLTKVAHKFTVKEVKDKRKLIKRQIYVPLVLMSVCIAFSICGAEIFWQKILLSQGMFFHIIGYILGVVCSFLLVLFEMREEVVQRIIERSISSNGLIQIALDQSAKSAIHNALFKARKNHLHSPEFTQVIDTSAKNGLYAVLSDALSMAGYTVSREQLEHQIEQEIEVRATAENFINTQGQIETPPIPLQIRENTVTPSTNGRKTKQRKIVEEAIKKYGNTRMLNDIPKFAKELNIAEKTLERWLNTLSA